MKFTKSGIDALTCPPGKREIVVFDAEVRGLGLRVTASGAKVFLFEYWRAGRMHRMRLAPCDQITLAGARKRASTLRGEVAAGRHPAEERKTERAREAAAAEARKRQALVDRFTFAVLLGRWEAGPLAGRRPRYRGEATRALRTNFADLAEKPAAAIDVPAARRALDRIEKERGAVMARRSHAYARAMFGWGKRQGLVAGNPFADIAPEGRDTARDRVLSDIELGEVWRAAVKLGAPYAGYVRFLLLTLQRVSEVAGLRRSELARDLTTWELPAARAKNGRGHIVHLVDAARAIIREAPPVLVLARGRATRSDLVFTTTGKTPLSGFSKAKANLDQAIAAEREKRAAELGGNPAPLVPWRLHDLRRTGVTTLARLKVSWEVADKILNHQQGAIGGVAAVYQRHDFFDERAAAMQLWADHVMKVGRREAAEDGLPPPPAAA